MPGRDLSLRMFPVGNRTWYDAKQRMCCGKANFKVAPINGRAAPAQLAQKPPPFVLQLSIGDENTLRRPDPTQLGAIKCVAPTTRLGIDERKVTVDGGAG